MGKFTGVSHDINNGDRFHINRLIVSRHGDAHPRPATGIRPCSLPRTMLRNYCRTQIQKPTNWQPVTSGSQRLPRDETKPTGPRVEKPRAGNNAAEASRLYGQNTFRNGDARSSRRAASSAAVKLSGSTRCPLHARVDDFGGLRFSPKSILWLVGLVITATYWFTASTSFANPPVTLARGSCACEGKQLIQRPSLAIGEHAEFL
jgi:hypothetical protein